jgi:hypothetical protein
LVGLLALASGQRAWAQGCILIREAAPVIGSISNTYLHPGEWELNVSFRDSTADEHYSLGVYQEQRKRLGTYVINTQRQTLFNLTHAVTTRFSVSASVPVIFASWSVPSPMTPTPGPRATQHGRGLGDVSAMGRYWVLDTVRHSSRNLSVGVGFKAPTGASAATDTFVDLTGGNLATKAVDQSVQPGDGGWGAQLEVQGFTRAGRAFIFGTANYLINPRNINNTPSILVGIGRPSETNPLRNVNSVPDQYVARVGVGVPVWKKLGASLSYRVEGVPRYDLIGRSDGFRRPGKEMYIEPGISFTTGRSTLQFNLPKGFYRYRAPDPYTGAKGDATFPDVVALGTYSYRFGTVKHVAMPNEPMVPPARAK